MQCTSFAGFQLSQLMLGTAQLGMNYGIANSGGQPAYEQARDILAAAHESGVNCLDTAAAYGDSEEIIGRALSELGLRERFVVVTKVPAVPPELGVSQWTNHVEENVHRSRQRLQLEVLPICLLHRESDARCLEALLKLRDKGWVQHVGVSCLTPSGAREVLLAEGCEAVQIPTNLLDQSFQETQVFSLAQQRGQAVFARSAFLQGLLLMETEAIPAGLAAVRPVLTRLRELARAAGLTMNELALRFVLGVAGLTCVVTGVDSETQVRDNARLFHAGPLPPDLMQAVHEAVPALPELITRPYLWPARTG